jgi:hypothetical protein
MVNSPDTYSVLLSAPIEIFWKGWRADTAGLQRAGWSISAHENYQRQEMRLALESPCKTFVGITHLEAHTYRRFMLDHHPHPFRVDTQLEVAQMAPEIRVHSASLGMPEMYPINAEPRIASMSEVSLRDIAHFQKVQTAKNEVFLKEASMEQILEMALKKQEPTQKEIRQRILKEQELRRYGQLHTELRLVS